MIKVGVVGGVAIYIFCVVMAAASLQGGPADLPQLGDSSATDVGTDLGEDRAGALA